MLRKSQVSDLALLGGKPLFADRICVGRPNIGSREKLSRTIDDILDRRWLTNNGLCLQEFERQIAALTGAPHCVAVANATLGLELTIQALNLQGEVIVPALTFVATPHAVRNRGLRPVFCDVDPETHNLDPAAVVRRITPRTSGLLGVHLWGRPCAVDALAELAEQHGLALLFDAAHAFGCSHQGRMIGNFGQAEVFSFHATKVCNSFEGGAIVTHDSALAGRLRRMRNFGFENKVQTATLGTNAKMHEVSAAMGLVSLASLEQFIDHNRRNYEAYRRALDGLPGLQLIKYDPAERCNYHYIVLEIDRQAAGIGRDELALILAAEHIMVRRYFYPGCHRLEPYATEQPAAGRHLPQSERVAARTLCLPTGTAVSASQVKAIGGLIRFVVDNADCLMGRVQPPAADFNRALTAATAA